MNPDNCPVCNMPWVEHDGPTRLCKELQAMREENRRLRAALKEVSGCYESDGGAPRLCAGCLMAIENALTGRTA